MQSKIDFTNQQNSIQLRLINICNQNHTIKSQHFNKLQTQKNAYEKFKSVDNELPHINLHSSTN